MEIKKYFQMMVEKNASDLFYRAGSKVAMRIDGEVVYIEDRILSVDEIFQTIEELTDERQKRLLDENKNVELTYLSDELGARFRISIFIQRGFPSFVVRNLSQKIRSFEELNLPGEVLRKLCLEKRGLVLLVGSAGSGKSTTIASMIEYMNCNFHRHILTVEEPIEFDFKDKNCVINQRELGLDVLSYQSALRAFTLQSPDVIYVGNIRDHDTMSAVLTAAETGVLVLSTMHTINASQTIERMVNFFPPYQHAEIRNQISHLLKGVISLRLIPRKDQPGRVPACEVMLLTPTISRLIREGKTDEIIHFIEEGRIFGMQSFTQSLIDLVKRDLITEEIAKEFSDSKEEFILALKGIKKV